MKRVFFFFLICFSSFQLSAQSIDTKHLVLRLDFDWQKKQAFGTAEITFVPLYKCNRISLDAGFLAIQKITLNQFPLHYEYKGDDTAKNLHILLDRFYEPEEKVTLEITYSTTYVNNSDPNALAGSFGKGLRFFQATSASPTKRKQLWSSGEPQGNKYWFPCNEELSDLHSTEIFATVEKPLSVISNGQLVETKDNLNGSQTFHFASTGEFPNYLVSLVIGEYANVMLLAGKTRINNFGYPNEIEAVKATVELLPNMLQFLESKTGIRYPYESYSQVVVQDYPFPGGVGQNTAAILSDNYIDDYAVHKDYKYLWDGVAVQALANQWFGNFVMPKEWRDCWLNNAFAEYFAGLYTTYCYGNSEYLLWYYLFEKSTNSGEIESGNIHPIVPKKISDVASFTSDSYSRYRAALVLRMLQNEVGEKNWWKAINYFLKSNAHKQVSTKDFQEAIEKVCGKSYAWFFNQWFYQIGQATFEVTKEYNKSTRQLRIIVEQKQPQKKDSTYEQVAYFEGKINLEIDNKLESIYIQPQQKNVFSFNCSSEPRFVNFNAEQIFLCELNYTQYKEECLAQMKFSKDVFAKREAMNQLVIIASDSTCNPIEKARIVDAIASEVKSAHYWRYRWAALGALSKLESVPYKPEMIALLKHLIQTEEAWLKAAAINILGNTKDSSYLEIYSTALTDKSDRVIAAAATALGKTKSSKAFDLLLQLEKQHSWKNQNRISALNGLQQLGDVRAVDYALSCISDNQSPRWFLATPAWDYPFTAVATLVTLGKAELAYPLLLERLKKSMQEEDINDIFQNLQLINLLALEEAKEAYSLLKEKYNKSGYLHEAVIKYEEQYLESLKK